MTAPQNPDEWQQWRDDYLGVASGPAAMPDPAALSARVKRETRRLWRGLALELLAAAGVTVFWLVLLARRATPALLPMACVSVAGVAAWVGYLVHAFRGQWMPRGDTVRAHLAATIARRQAEARWFGFALAWTAVMGLAVAAWAPVILRARWAIYQAEPWRAVVGFGVAFAILAGCLAYYQRRRARALREARAWAALWDGDDLSE